MTYLVKSLVDTKTPSGTDWPANQTREVDDTLIRKYQNNPGAFTVLAGPDHSAVIVAAQQLTAAAAAGAKNGATVTATESGNGTVHQTTLTLAATPVTMRDVEQGGGVKVYDFPAGRILLLGATSSIAVTTTSAVAGTLNPSVVCNYGVGSTTQANATLATTEQDMVQVTAFTSSANPTEPSAVANGFGALVALDGTTTPVDAFLNLAVAGATDIDGDATVTVAGTITLTWVNLGDY